MKITYDPASDAMYIRIADSERHGQTIVDDNGNIVDVDEDGTPIGIELLAVRARGLDLDSLPPQVRNEVGEFLTACSLETDQFIERCY